MLETLAKWVSHKGSPFQIGPLGLFYKEFSPEIILQNNLVSPLSNHLELEEEFIKKHLSYSVSTNLAIS
jgi:hypothetical protein